MSMNLYKLLEYVNEFQERNGYPPTADEMKMFSEETKHAEESIKSTDEIIISQKLLRLLREAKELKITVLFNYEACIPGAKGSSGSYWTVRLFAVEPEKWEKLLEEMISEKKEYMKNVTKLKELESYYNLQNG